MYYYYLLGLNLLLGRLVHPRLQQPFSHLIIVVSLELKTISLPLSGYQASDIETPANNLELSDTLLCNLVALD